MLGHGKAVVRADCGLVVQKVGLLDDAHAARDAEQIVKLRDGALVLERDAEVASVRRVDEQLVVRVHQLEL